jgi:heptosyltransferase-2
MGDAILCVPALRAIRRRFDSSKITFLGSSVVRQVLSPSSFVDVWLHTNNFGVLALAGLLKKQKFTKAILFKNSFGSALCCFLARIPVRVGYAREGRGILLTERLHPPRLPSGNFKPISMVDYYLAIASSLGADVQDRRIELSIEPKDTETVKTKLPQVFSRRGPLVVLVPGAAAGPSKRWPAERFAKVADRLAADYNATVVLSVAPNPEEKNIAEQIVNAASHKLVNLGETPVSLGELKALYAAADLVIGNDTGPRHIAIALKRKVITLVGPNDPAWTDPGYNDEVFIKGEAPCAPCDKGICREKSHFCMEAITVEMVCRAAANALEAKAEKKPDNNNRRPDAADFFVDPAYKKGLEKLGLTSIEAVFSFQAGKNLTKENLAPYRSRIEFQIESPAVTLFLKRYDRPPMAVQLKNWMSAKKQTSCAYAEADSARNLKASGVNVAKMVAWGESWGPVFENRSFIITEKIPDGVPLERGLPEFFNSQPTAENLKIRQRFIRDLAGFIRKFHETGYRHRDLYLCHIFRVPDGRFFLIDLARAFRPAMLDARYRIKDLAQLNHSAPAQYFSNTDKMRFYITYTGESKMTTQDKHYIKKIIYKTRRIARHDSKRMAGRIAQ